MAVTLKPVSKISGLLGQQGEERVAALLEEELSDQDLVLNSPRLAHNSNVVDIDHIVITPASIFVIECKNMNGRISGGLMGNWVQERFTDGHKEFIKIGNPASQVNQYAKVVRDYVRGHYQELFGVNRNFKVEPIVVFSHEQSNLSGMQFTSRGKIGKVQVLLLKDLVPFIVSHQAENLTCEEMEQCADIIVPPDQRDQTGVYPVLAELPRESFRNRFQILEELGRGSCGTVYRAFDTKLDREVAVKRLDPINKRSCSLERFTREAKITARLNHRNIVRFYDYYEDDQEFYLVMEIVEGLTLRELLEEGAFSLREVAEVFPFILGAIEYAHENNVVHRDLKAANILLTAERMVKVTDFGVARLLDEGELTQTRASIGTPANMAPEQIMGETGDHRVDIFGLGVLLYQLLTGELPFQADSLGETVNKILREEPQPPSFLNPSVPRQLDQVVMKALQKDPALRFATVREMAAAFAEATDPAHLAEMENSGGNKGVLSNFFMAGHGWLRFWRDDRRKFYSVALATVIVFGWMISLQLYVDSRMTQDKQSPVKTGQYNILAPWQNNNIISNDNIKSLFPRLLSLSGREVRLTGRITGVVEQDKDKTIFQVAVRPTGAQEDLHLLLSFGGDPHTLIRNNDLITDVQVTGVMGKIPAVDSKTNSMVEVPLVVVERMEVLEPWNVMAPAKFELPVNQTVKRNGKEVTLQKIEFADTETRLYLVVKNTSLQKALVYLDNPLGIQGGRRITQLYNLDNNYHLELEPGKEVKGLVVIGAMSPLINGAEFRLGNDILGESPWVFTVHW